MTEAPVKTALTELLGQIRNGKEIRAYLDRFAAASGTRFAVFKLGGAVLAKDLDTVAAGLALLNSVGLTPVVVHGAGPQLDQAIADAHLDAGKKDGLRVTTAEIMELTGRISAAASLNLCHAISEHGGRAVAVPSLAVRADILDEDKYGLVGDPSKVYASLIHQITDSGAIPVLSNVGVDNGGRLVNINADSVARALARCFEPLKIVFVTGTGGLLDAEGQVITSVNLQSELESLISTGTVHSGMQLKLEEIGKLLEALPPASSVSITSPDGIVRELFTHGGQGTLVRRGEAYETYDSAEGIDIHRLQALVESAFNRTLPDDYLPGLPVHKIYISTNYRAAAVLIRMNGNILLDKFVVSPDARGEGLSHALWRMMTENDPVIFWRARRNNGFNEFYHAKADGYLRHTDWNIFWTGQPGFEEIENMTAAIISRPPSFVEDNT